EGLEAGKLDRGQAHAAAGCLGGARPCREPCSWVETGFENSRKQLIKNVWTRQFCRAIGKYTDPPPPLGRAELAPLLLAPVPSTAEQARLYRWDRRNGTPAFSPDHAQSPDACPRPAGRSRPAAQPQPARALQRDAQRAAVPAPDLVGQPGAERGQPRPAPGAGVPADPDALRRQ